MIAGEGLLLLQSTRRGTWGASIPEFPTAQGRRVAKLPWSRRKMLQRNSERPAGHAVAEKTSPLGRAGAATKASMFHVAPLAGGDLPNLLVRAEETQDPVTASIYQGEGVLRGPGGPASSKIPR